MRKTLTPAAIVLVMLLTSVFVVQSARYVRAVVAHDVVVSERNVDVPWYNLDTASDTVVDGSPRYSWERPTKNNDVRADKEYYYQEHVVSVVIPGTFPFVRDSVLTINRMPSNGFVFVKDLGASYGSFNFE